MENVKFKHLHTVQLVNYIEAPAFLKIVELLSVEGIFEQFDQKQCDHICSCGTNQYSGIRSNQIDIYWQQIQDHLDSAIGMEWMNPIKGTFPKRLSSYFYKQYNVKIPTEVLSKIGTLASAGNSNTTTCYFDIFDCATDSYWNSGKFGDGGSCLWGGRAEALDMFKANKVMALRIYDEVAIPRAFDGVKEKYKDINEWFWSLLQTTRDDFGRGRAWMYYDQNLKSYIFWNGYDARGQFQSLHFARLWATYIGYTYHRLKPLLNEGKDGGKVYINGATGWLVYATDNKKAELTTSYDFGFKRTHSDEMYRCEDCGYENYEPEEFDVDVDGRTICRECADDAYSRCRYDGQLYYNDNGEYVMDEVAAIIDGTKYYEGFYGNPDFIHNYIIYCDKGRYAGQYVFKKHTKITAEGDVVYKERKPSET